MLNLKGIKAMAGFTRKQIGDGTRTDPAEVSKLIIDLAKKHGWDIAASGIELICNEAGMETYIVSGYGAVRDHGVILPDRPYTMTKAGDLIEVKSE